MKAKKITSYNEWELNQVEYAARLGHENSLHYFNNFWVQIDVKNWYDKIYFKSVEKIKVSRKSTLSRYIRNNFSNKVLFKLAHHSRSIVDHKISTVIFISKLIPEVSSLKIKVCNCKSTSRKHGQNFFIIFH